MSRMWNDHEILQHHLDTLDNYGNCSLKRLTEKFLKDHPSVEIEYVIDDSIGFKYCKADIDFVHEWFNTYGKELQKWSQK